MISKLIEIGKMEAQYLKKVPKVQRLSAAKYGIMLTVLLLAGFITSIFGIFSHNLIYIAPSVPAFIFCTAVLFEKAVLLKNL